MIYKFKKESKKNIKYLKHIRGKKEKNEKKRRERFKFEGPSETSGGEGINLIEKKRGRQQNYTLNNFFLKNYTYI